MLLFDLKKIGNRIYNIRKQRGLTQIQVAERAGLSERTYGQIEHGAANMRMETLLKICHAINITPDDILIVENPSLDLVQTELFVKLERCSIRERETALNILKAYLDSLNL